MTKVVVAHPDDDVLFFAPELFRAPELEITYVFVVSRLREVGVCVAHFVAGLRVKRVFMRLPWDQNPSFNLEGEVWTHDPGDLEDHPHHQRVACAVLRGAKGRVRVFTGYGLPREARTVHGLDYVRKATMWLAYSLFDSHVRPFGGFYRSCWGRCHSKKTTQGEEKV